MWQKGFSNNPDGLSWRLIGWSGAKKKIQQNLILSLSCQTPSDAGLSAFQDQTFLITSAICCAKLLKARILLWFGAKAKLLLKRKRKSHLENGPVEPVYFPWPHLVSRPKCSHKQGRLNKDDGAGRKTIGHHASKPDSWQHLQATRPKSTVCSLHNSSQQLQGCPQPCLPSPWLP